MDIFPELTDIIPLDYPDSMFEVDESLGTEVDTDTRRDKRCDTNPQANTQPYDANKKYHKCLPDGPPDKDIIIK